MKTIYICLDGSTVIGAGGSLLNLFNNTQEMQKKSYHFYNRKLKSENEMLVVCSEKMLKVIRVRYAK